MHLQQMMHRQKTVRMLPVAKTRKLLYNYDKNRLWIIHSLFGICDIWRMPRESTTKRLCCVAVDFYPCIVLKCLSVGIVKK